MGARCVRRSISLAAIAAIAMLMASALGCHRKSGRRGDPKDVELVWLSDYPGELSILVGGKTLYLKNEPVRMSSAKHMAQQLGLEIGHPLMDLQREDLPDGTTTWHYRNGTKIEFLFDGKIRPLRLAPHPGDDPEFYRYLIKVEP